MASLLKVDKLDPQSGTALEIGTSGDTITVPSGATLDISASTLTPPATMPASSGVNFTALNATNLGSGTVAIARGGTGAATLAGAGLANTPAFWAYKATSGQAIANDTWTLLTFQTETLDSDTDFDMSTYKFTPTTAGWYYLFSQVYWATATDATSILIGITKNSTTVNHIAYGTGYNYYYDSVAISALGYANGSSDYFCAACYQNSGGSINTAADEATHFGGYKIIGA